tara:strand:+ start:1574 stop:1867 length:294 start_codon:yes stop_codon:yes gene_type:complete
MSGYVPKRVQQARTASGREGDRKGMREGQTMLSLPSTIGRSAAVRRSIKSRGFSSFLKIDCKEGVTRNKDGKDSKSITALTCKTLTDSIVAANNNIN